MTTTPPSLLSSIMSTASGLRTFGSGTGASPRINKEYMPRYLNKYVRLLGKFLSVSTLLSTPVTSISPSTFERLAI